MSVEFPIVSAIFIVGISSITAQSTCLAKKAIAATHQEFVTALDNGYYVMISQPQKYLAALYFNRKRSEVKKIEPTIKKLSDRTNKNKCRAHCADIASEWNFFIAASCALIYIMYVTIFNLPDKLSGLIPMILLERLRELAKTLSRSIIIIEKNEGPFSKIVNFITARHNEDDLNSPPLTPNTRDLTIEFDKVTFEYPKRRFRIEATFKIEPGTATAVIGPTGSGKSTIMKLMLRLLTPQSGKILIGGVDINTCNANSVRRLFGIVPQQPNLSENDVISNIQYGLPENEAYETSNPELAERAKQAATLAGLSDFVENNQLHSSTGEFGNTVSGGQAQRIAIARGFIRAGKEGDDTSPRAKVFIFDEPTSAVDPKTRDFIWKSIYFLLRRGNTVIIITHDVASVKESIPETRVIDVSTFQSPTPSPDTQEESKSTPNLQKITVEP